jgi:cell division protein FtsI/penicillin-binding protein 2
VWARSLPDTLAAASVAHGGTVTPHLVLSPSPTRTTGGTASASTSGSPSPSAPPVAAKTGTAEYGTDNPPQTHAWMVGYQGGIAFAAFVHDGATGAGTAGPIVESFRRALAAG